MENNLSLVLAFGAGLLSFLSPCVLPLIPSYLTFIGGVGLDDLREEKSSRQKLLFRTVFFIFGFSGVFVILGLLFSGSILLLGGITRIINIAAGGVVVLLGLNIIFDFLAFLNYEKRFHPTSKPKGLFGSLIVGMAFGAGWSPCVGPILGGILLLAGQTGEIGRSILYLSAYSLGLGIPFLGAALFFDYFLKSLGKLKKHLPRIKKASGLLLVFIGLLIMFGKFQELNRFFLKTGTALADWESTGSAAVRWIPALFFLIAGIIPLIKRITTGKPVFSGAAPVFFVLSWSLGLAHLTGVLSLTGMAASWLLYQGI